MTRSPSDKAQQAISDYLDALLEDLPQAEKPVSIQLADKPARVVALDQLIAEIQVEAPARPAVVPVEPVVIAEAVAKPVKPVASDASGSGVPEWAEHPFQCLLFKVSGLTLAVPLIKLNSVIPWSDNITHTPNKTSWYLGLVQSHGANVKVIDTALMVLPENRRSSIDLDPSHRFSHILLVDNYTWGLACDAIGDVIWLDQHKVKWRKDKTRRPWLAGTALEQLCAIIDTEVFAEMMNANVAKR
ncbi:MAG: chemotaxis protein CheW [Gammaproteobacteria bacterium]|jgi:purine-binding chemotaxis protein CheW|nr:chemotaxis protein CheW [Gammaproteobacteria bacterium]